MNLEKFYDKSSDRKHISQPNNFDGRTFATNGKALISIPEDTKYSDNTDLTLQDSIRNIFKRSKDLVYVKFKFTNTHLGKLCIECKGIGKAIYETCIECDGPGYLEFNTDYHSYTVDCISCHGDGEKIFPHIYGEICHNCNGHGIINDCVSILGRNYQYKHIKSISEFNNTLISPLHDKAMLYFKADNDINGVIMEIK